MRSLPRKPKQRVRAELLNTHTAGILDTNTMTTFTLLPEMRTQSYMWSLDKVGCIADTSQQSFCHWWQNIHYHLTNLQNHPANNIFDVVRKITSKQQFFSVRSSPDPPIFKKIAVRSSRDPAKIGHSPDSIRSCPDTCSPLSGAQLCAHGAREFWSQQNGAVTRMWRACHVKVSQKELAIGEVRLKKEGMLLQPLRWRCAECTVHHKQNVREAKNNTTCMRCEQAIEKWLRRVISIVAWCHSAKLCPHAALPFWSQQ